MTHRALSVLAATVAAFSLAACSGGRQAIGEAMGISVESPNAFNVAPRKPLRLPSDLSGALPPPQPGAASPLDPQPEAEARAALDASPARSGAAPSAGEQALLDAAGANSADPRIRAELEADAEDPGEARYAIEQLFGYRVPTEADRRAVLEPREAADEVRGSSAQTPNAPPPPAEPEPGTIGLPLSL